MTDEERICLHTAAGRLTRLLTVGTLACTPFIMHAEEILAYWNIEGFRRVLRHDAWLTMLMVIRCTKRPPMPARLSTDPDTLLLLDDWGNGQNRCVLVYDNVWYGP